MNLKRSALINKKYVNKLSCLLALYNYMVKSNVYKDFDYKVSFIFVPAEEYLDLAYRDTLMQQNKITHYGGKPEAMKLGVFDDIDLSICVHAIGGEFAKRTINTNCDINICLLNTLVILIWYCYGCLGAYGEGVGAKYYLSCLGS